MTECKLAKPTRQQMAWQDMEMGMFCHFGLNTFMDKEWGDGTDLPDVFNPVSLDCRQWAKAAKQAGFKYIMLTAKHHDGFCLWPTKTTDYSVRSSPWKDGRGDVVKECADACREEGILFGIYLSPWDRHESCYNDKEAYDRFYLEQLQELLTGYGPLVEIWFDGAGSEDHDYDWRSITDIISKYQLNAMVFNLGRPTVRWVGNEDGLAPYPCWNSATTARVSMYTQEMNTWLPDTPEWVPAECDVPIRKSHWFWHPDDEKSLLSLEALLDIYYRSIGHGANLLLNIAPDVTGRFPDADVDRIMEFSNEINKHFSSPLGMVSGKGYSIELELAEPSRVNHAVIMEDIAEGERIQEYVLEARLGNAWVLLLCGSAVGHKKVDCFNDVETQHIRIMVMKAADEPLIRYFAVFNIKQ